MRHLRPKLLLGMVAPDSRRRSTAPIRHMLRFPFRVTPLVTKVDKEHFSDHPRHLRCAVCMATWAPGEMHSPAIEARLCAALFKDTLFGVVVSGHQKQKKKEKTRNRNTPKKTTLLGPLCQDTHGHPRVKTAPIERSRPGD